MLATQKTHINHFKQPLLSILNGTIPAQIALQPIYDLRSGLIYGHEVLARCGDLSPDRLFASAHVFNLIRPLEMLLVKQILACRLTVRGPLFVNVYPTIPSPAMWQVLKNANVILEITEAGAARLEAVQTLRNFGFSLALDDVGTGFSNLEALASIQPEYIKLDKSLIQSPHTEARNSIIQALLDHASRLKVTIIAEGIENEEHLQVAKLLNIPFGQGFHLGRPELFPQVP